jgi:hypothetical protein
MVLRPLSSWHAPFIGAVPPDFLGTQARRLCCSYLNRGRAEKNKTKGGKTSFWTFDQGVKGIILTIHMPKNVFLGCIQFRKSISAQRNFHRVTPVRSMLKSVDGLGAVDTRKDQTSGARLLHYIQIAACSCTCSPRGL